MAIHLQLTFMFPAPVFKKERAAMLGLKKSSLGCCLVGLGMMLVDVSWGAKPADERDSPTPRVVKTIPAIGATQVDPALTEIRITFERDMQKGMSWTGGKPHFPNADPKKKARWIDTRTCVLPVQLASGSYYRLGINSTSFQNFKSEAGVAADPLSIYFTTQGAAKELVDRVGVPKIVAMIPASGAEDVDPSITEIKVTFDRPMGTGMSWTGGGEKFPDIPEGQIASWSKDGLTCTLPVKLITQHEYQIGINSPSHQNFASSWGVPLEPVRYVFKTK
jgi:hypothetical protein